MTDRQRVLVVGNPDEIDPGSILSEIPGFTVETVCDPTQAEDCLMENNIDCVLTSGEGANTTTIAAVAEHSDVPVLMLTEDETEPAVVELEAPTPVAGGAEMPAQKTVLSHQIEAAVVDEQAAYKRPTPDPATIYERITDGFFAVDKEWRYTYVNNEGAALTGRSKTELLGTRVWDAFPELIDSPFEDALRQAMQSGETATVEAHYPAHGIWYDVRAYPDEAGISIYFRDVTEAVARREKLQRENERLEKFVSIVSHDLRNPLNVISGALELIKESGDTSHTELGLRGVRRMENLIQDLLTIAREGNRIEELETIDLHEMCLKCWETVDTHTATLDVVGEYTLQADRSRLKQLLENLFRNAVEHGGDDVTVTVGSLADSQGFYVADNGAGIPKEDQESVFEHGYSSSPTGTGLGLSIVKEIVRAHNWHIVATDSESGGAQFNITGVSNGPDR